MTSRLRVSSHSSSHLLLGEADKGIDVDGGAGEEVMCREQVAERVDVVGLLGKMLVQQRLIGGEEQRKVAQLVRERRGRQLVRRRGKRVRRDRRRAKLGAERAEGGERRGLDLACKHVQHRAQLLHGAVHGQRFCAVVCIVVGQPAVAAADQVGQARKADRVHIERGAGRQHGGKLPLGKQRLLVGDDEVGAARAVGVAADAPIDFFARAARAVEQGQHGVSVSSFGVSNTVSVMEKYSACRMRRRR